jgi:hypothetical protein
MKRDVNEGRLCLGGLQLPPKRRAQGIEADASRSDMRWTRRGRPETDIGSGSGSGLKLGGEGLKTCGIIELPQDNLTLFAEPNRAPMGPKAGPLCAVVPDFFCAGSTAEQY